MKSSHIFKQSIISIIAVLILCSIALPQEKLRIAFIPKSGSGIFWKSIYTGAKLGAVALGNVEVVWRAPSFESTIPQMSVVEQCIEEGLAGIVLAPLEKDSLAVPVAKAIKKKIPVLIFDTELTGKAGKDYISFVGINNKKAGAIAGEHIANLLNGSGKIVMLRVTPDQSNIVDREKGFIEVLNKYKGIQIIEKNHYAGHTTEDAFNESLKLVDKLKQADGVFCSYEQSTVAMLQALKKIGLAGKVKFLGFDTPSSAIEGLKKGEISALVAQDPAHIGYLCIKTIVDYSRGKKIEPIVDSGVQIITRENLNNPEIQKLFALPVKE